MEEASRIAVELFKLGGLGHTLGIHAEDEKVVEAFTIKNQFHVLL
jgi:acetaldehyde dehydrogenase (acetylating)